MYFPLISRNGRYKEGWAFLPRSTTADQRVEMYIAPQKLKPSTHTTKAPSIHGGKKSPN